MELTDSRVMAALGNPRCKRPEVRSTGAYAMALAQRHHVNFHIVSTCINYMSSYGSVS